MYFQTGLEVGQYRYCGPGFHSGKISALPPWKWTFGEWKAVVVRIHMLQKWNAQTFPRKAKFHTAKEAKWTSKPQNIQNVPASIPQFPAETTFGSKFFHNTDVVRGFSEQWKWKPLNVYICGFDVYFAYFSVWNFICQICGLIRQAKRS
jgi:hypothetical protein